jgi:DNA-directed RNA polymerase N-terminal
LSPEVASFRDKFILVARSCNISRQVRSCRQKSHHFATSSFLSPEVATFHDKFVLVARSCNISRQVRSCRQKSQHFTTSSFLWPEVAIFREKFVLVAKSFLLLRQGIDLSQNRARFFLPLLQRGQISLTLFPNTLMANDIERQRALEADAVQLGAERYFRNLEHQSATDSKVGQDIVKNSLKPLADRIFQEQRVFKFRQDGKAPKSGVPLISLHHEKLALITIGMLINALAKSNVETGQGLPVTGLGFDIGQRCRAERIFDLLRGRGIDIAAELITRHRTRNAKRLADIMARKLDDPDDWATNYLSHHLGEKLIALAVQFVQFNGRPVFEKNTVVDPSDPGKTIERISLTEAAADWIAANEKDMAAMASPAYLPMIMPPRPWTTPTEGGYLMHQLNLVKGGRKRTQKVLEAANLGVVRSAVNAMQWTPWRFNKDICGPIAAAWDARLPLFGQKKWQKDVNPAPRLRGLEGVMRFHMTLSAKLAADLLSASVGLSRPRVSGCPAHQSSGGPYRKSPTGVCGRQAARRARRVLARDPSLQLLLEGKESVVREAPGMGPSKRTGDPRVCGEASRKSSVLGRRGSAVALLRRLPRMEGLSRSRSRVCLAFADQHGRFL